MRTILGAFHAQKLTLTANQATHLKGTDTGGARPATPRLSLVVLNATSDVLYLGGPAVDAANGYPLPAGQAFPADCTGGLHAFSAVGGPVHLLEGF